MLTRRAILQVGVGGALPLTIAGCTEGGLESVPDSVLGADKRGEIVGTYDEGIGHLNDGHTTRDGGIVAFNEKRYEEAIDTLEQSIVRYSDAAASFRESKAMSEDAGVPPAAKICSDAASHAKLMGQSTGEARKAAEAAAAGEPANVINGHTATSQELQAEAEELSVADPEELLAVLEAKT